MTVRLLFGVCLVVAWVILGVAQAHEVRPGYLQLQELGGGNYDVLGDLLSK